jgi:hypothetical protein
MNSPHLASQTQALAWRSGDDTVFLHDLGAGKEVSFSVGRLGHMDISISPDGRFVVAPLVLESPLGYYGNPTIVDLRNPSRKHYLGRDYRFKWVAEENVPQPN